MLINLDGFGQSPILVRLSNSPGPVTPGGYFTLFFDVTSRDPLLDSIQESVTLPDKWKLLSKRRPERVTGQKELRYFFVIGTPESESAGDFRIDFTIRSGNEVVTTPAVISIQEIRKLEIFIVSQPEFIKEGDTLRVQYLVRNSGNKQEKFAVKTNYGIVENVTDSLILAPNSQVNVTTSQIIPFTEKNAWERSADLSVGSPDIPKDVYGVVSVPVFSTKVKKIDPYFRLPAEIGGGYLSYTYGGSTRIAYQYFAAGRGYVDQKEKHHVDFTIRGPNQIIFPAAGGYDQYSLEYQYKKNTVISAGDYVLQLNNLMEFGRLGRGVKLEQQFQKLDYTVFYQKARFTQSQKQAFGGKVTYKMSRFFNLGASYATKDVTFQRQNFWTHLAGISGRLRTANIGFETELVAGNAKQKTDYGVFARLQLARKWVTVTSNFIYAGKNFYGFYHNSLLISNNIGINITRKLTLGLGSNFSDVNPSLDATFYSISPKERSYMAYGSYQINKQNRLLVFYSIQERQDRQAPASFHYSENFGNLSYNLDSDKFALFYQGQYGYSRNHLVFDNTAQKESFSNLVQPSVRFFPWIWVGGYLQHQHTSKFSSSNIVENLFFYGGNVRINVGQKLLVNFMYRNNYAPDELYVRRSFLDASLLLDLKRHRITVAGGRSYVPNMENTGQNTLFFSLKYALKLNVPLSRKRNVGSVSGKLTGTGFSKTGNLIQLGSHKFLTDSTGEFYFKGIAPDRYYLSVVQNESKQVGVIPNIRIPMYLDVKADSVKVIEIPFTRTGNIIGKVDFVKPSQNGLSSVLSEKPTILIKLSNETTSFLTELTPEGKFSFKEMKPGNWNISASIPGSQDRFIIEDANRSLHLEIDKTMDIIFRVRPNEKRIHFSERNFEVSVKK
ncbi:hypothetical protein [Dyadobacter pollutisoli]|uniref:Carboxypeptidase regulatory-like domain-containing protein n=1 Tax=Dyadobacter pollutisoli TaxID=2910158 RepID=A0A9E8SMF9_9BACT|nr:hypothetical protein [Dyadobacter pollutisoli]WAC14700.1 hypothetical protein ON006_12205 [Dyadobacter pollutisoli]